MTASDLPEEIKPTKRKKKQSPQADDMIGEQALDSLADFNGAKALEEIRLRQKRQERITLAVAVLFVFGIIGAVALSEGDVMKATVEILQSASGMKTSKDPGINCSDARNKKTKYCIERAGEVESNWRSVVRTQDGKSNAFTLHQPGDASNNRR